MTAAINQGAYHVGATVPMLMDMIAERNGSDPRSYFRALAPPVC